MVWLNVVKRVDPHPYGSKIKLHKLTKWLSTMEC